MSTSATPRPLTTDEKKAAEAAFRGEPPDSKWSASARAVYEGIMKVTGPRATPLEDATVEQTATPSEEKPAAQTDQVAEASQTPPVMTREEAIQAGYLVDVTPIAHSVGLPVPVSLSQPLWTLGITASDTIPEDQREARVRDVLMALRLRIANERVASSGIEFPALLTFPPGPVPQLLSLHAIAHGDQTTPYALTVLLTNEVAVIVRPPTN